MFSDVLGLNCVSTAFIGQYVYIWSIKQKVVSIYEVWENLSDDNGEHVTSMYKF